MKIAYLAYLRGYGRAERQIVMLANAMAGMEMGTEAGRPETSHIIDAINTFCKLRFENGIGIIDEDSSTEGRLVLGWFKYPIITRYETDMLQQIEEWGYEDVMKNICFCHNPIRGKPCGFCHLCAVKMESEMQWLLPDQAQKHYRNYNAIKKNAAKRRQMYIVI